MNSKSFIIATLVGAVTSFIAGYLVYGVILHEYMMSNSLAGFAKDPDFLWIIVSHILLGAGLTYIWMKWAGIKTFMGGLQAGLILGVIFALSIGCVYYGTSNLYTGLTAVLVDSLGSAFIWALGGAGAGWSLGKL